MMMMMMTTNSFQALITFSCSESSMSDELDVDTRDEDCMHSCGFRLHATVSEVHIRDHHLVS